MVHIPIAKVINGWHSDVINPEVVNLKPAALVFAQKLFLVVISTWAEFLINRLCPAVRWGCYEW